MSEQIPHCCDGGHDPSDEVEGEVKHYEVITRVGKRYTFWYCPSCADLDRRHGLEVREIGQHES